MTHSSKRGIVLLVGTFLLAAAAFALPAPAMHGAQPLATCPSLECPNRTMLTCTTPPCNDIDNCSIRCGGHILRCGGNCIPE